MPSSSKKETEQRECKEDPVVLIKNRIGWGPFCKPNLLIRREDPVVLIQNRIGWGERKTKKKNGGKNKEKIKLIPMPKNQTFINDYNHFY